MAGSRPQEHGESSEGLQSLVDAICLLIPQLPVEMIRTTKKGVRTIMVQKTEQYRGGESYIGGGDKIHITSNAHSYGVAVKEQASGSYMLNIKYDEPYIKVDNAPRHDCAPGPYRVSVARQLKVLTMTGEQVLEVCGDDIKVQPKVIEQDIKLIVDFLADAVTQHRENERVEIEKREAKVLELADKTRSAIQSL